MVILQFLLNSVTNFLISEPILSYKKGSKERKELIKALEKAKCVVEDVPIGRIITALTNCKAL